MVRRIAPRSAVHNVCSVGCTFNVGGGGASLEHCRIICPAIIVGLHVIGRGPSRVRPYVPRGPVVLDIRHGSTMIETVDGPVVRGLGLDTTTGVFRGTRAYPDFIVVDREGALASVRCGVMALRKSAAEATPSGSSSLPILWVHIGGVTCCFEGCP